MEDMRSDRDPNVIERKHSQAERENSSSGGFGYCNQPSSILINEFSVFTPPQLMQMNSNSAPIEIN